MHRTSGFEARRLTLLIALTGFVVASFGVDVTIKNADACSFPGYFVECFEPQSLGGSSDAPTKPDLREVLADHERYVDGGCGAPDSSCSGTKYSTVTFTVSDESYDDLDDVDELGLMIRTESNSRSSREFREAFRLPSAFLCSDDGAVSGNEFRRAFDGDLGSQVIELTFTTDNFTSSRFSDVRVSIAFVDQNGNIGPFSNPVELERRSRQITP